MQAGHATSTLNPILSKALGKKIILPYFKLKFYVFFLKIVLFIFLLSFWRRTLSFEQNQRQ